MDDESGMMTEMSWEVDEEVNRDKTDEADEMHLEVDFKDEVMHIYGKWAICDFQGGDGWRRERVTTDEERVPRGGWKEIS